jgi:ankyrin repeat protein
MNGILDQELILAAEENNLQYAVELLVQHGADVNAKDNRNRTPLIWASQSGHVQVVVEFLVHGADIETKDNMGSTALHFACSRGHVTVVQALLSSGADIFAVNK